MSKEEEKEGGEGERGRGQGGGVLDEALYSRQLYVMGHDASSRMANSTVLVVGLGGLGAEIAKNIILMGVKAVALFDSKIVTYYDLTTNFYLRESDVEGPLRRAAACKDRLAELNPYVHVTVETDIKLSKDMVAKYTVVVLTEPVLEERMSVNAWCRELQAERGAGPGRGPYMVMGSTRGLCGQVFCDFGDNFEVLEPGVKDLATFPVAGITCEEEGLVTLPPKTFHGLKSGDLVTFSGVRGMTQLNDCRPHVVKVVDGMSFRVGDTRGGGKYTGGGECREVHRPVTVSFLPLADARTRAPVYVVDQAKEKDRLVLHVAFESLPVYGLGEGGVPRQWNKRDADHFLMMWRTLNERRSEWQRAPDNFDLVRTFSYTALGQVPAVTAVVGGVVAQEVAKACSAKFMPLQQWLYLDALECLPADTSRLMKGDADPIGTIFDEPEKNRYISQVVLFGRHFQKVLERLKYFVVGAGAIGCELLKNLALMGVGAGPGGGLTVTDMDIIEKSNLNRQFLFRPSDVKKSKSVTAAAAVKAINPKVHVTPQQTRVGPETEHVYDAAFFEGLDGVVTALDNVEARRYMDHCCWLYHLPMLESGTLGASGSVQPVVPGVTERYDLQQVPSDRPVAMCTLRKFPSTIHHTLQWARDEFEGEFSDGPEAARRYLEGYVPSDPDPDTVTVLRRVLVEEAANSYQECVDWARRRWQLQFHDAVLDLLQDFPPDLMTSNGAPFWSGSKRCPSPLTFCPEEPLHLDYVHAAANLRAAVYGLPQVRDRQQTLELVAGVAVPPHRPAASSANDVQQLEQMAAALTLQDLPQPATLSSLALTPLSFEKDDDTNFHMDFITAASNLRAANYDIPPADHAASKKIAGRIVPAIVTSTAVAAGLACLELVKVVQGHRKLESFRTTEFSLALCRFYMAEPAPPPDLVGQRWGMWERLEVEGELTLAQFLELFKSKHQLQVTMVAAGSLTLHSFMLPHPEMVRRSAMTLTAILQELVGEKRVGPVVMLELGAEDLEGQEVEVPPVRYSVKPPEPRQQGKEGKKTG